MEDRILKKYSLFISVSLMIQFGMTPIRALAADKDTLLINSGSSAPLILNDGGGFYPQLVASIFERLNLKTNTIRLPSARSLKNANLGIDDGVMGRIKGLDKKLTNLIRVPEKVLDLEFVAFTNDKNLRINKWVDLKQYNVGYIRGDRKSVV